MFRLLDSSGLGRLYVICNKDSPPEEPRYLLTKLETGMPYSYLPLWRDADAAEAHLKSLGFDGYVVTLLSREGLKSAEESHARSGLQLFLKVH